MMTRYPTHGKRAERILHRYFTGRRRRWGRRSLRFVLLVVLSVTALRVWLPGLERDYILSVREILPVEFLRRFDQAFEVANPYVVQAWHPLQERTAALPVPDAVYHWLAVPEAERGLFLIGVGIPLLIFGLAVVNFLLLVLVRSVAILFRPKEVLTPYDLDDDNAFYDQLTEDEIVSDRRVDVLLHERIEKLVERSFQELNTDEDELEMLPLVVRAPVLWHRPGLGLDDLRWRLGTDGLPRFGIYQMLIIHLTDCDICIFKCHYDFVKDISFNESRIQRPYSHITGVTISDFDDDETLTLRSGDELKARQQFRILFDDGTKISVTIDAVKLSQEAGIQGALPRTGAEQAYGAINKFLREQNATAVPVAAVA